MSTIYVGFSPNGGNEQAIVNMYNGLSTKLDIADYSFTNTAIETAIEAAAGRNIPVRVVFDQKQTTGVQATLHDKLEQVQGVSIKLYSPSGGIMHDKYSIGDSHLVENGSFNYTEAAEHKNWENVQIHDDVDLASLYTANFEKLWGVATLEVAMDKRVEVRAMRAELCRGIEF